MLYPLYDYYQLSKLTLEEIVDDYLKNFYYKRYSQSKSENVEKRVQNSKKIAAIDAISIQKHVVPNSIDFGSAINETLWFIFQSNSTQALAVLIAAREWNKRINRKYHICREKEIRDKALYIFKKYSIYEEMTQKRFEEMTQNNDGENKEKGYTKTSSSPFKTPENSIGKGDEDLYKKLQASMEERFGITPDDIERTIKGLHLAPDLSKNDNIENKLLNLAKEGVEYIGKNFRELDEKGYYEALLLCTTFVIDLGTDHQNEIDLDKMEDRYFLLLCDTMIHCQLKDEIGFINKRIGFYTEEMKKLEWDYQYSASTKYSTSNIYSIYNAFYYNPLCNDPTKRDNSNEGYFGNNSLPHLYDIMMLGAVLMMTKDMLLKKKLEIIEWYMS